MKTYIQEACLS